MTADCVTNAAASCIQRHPSADGYRNRDRISPLNGGVGIGFTRPADELVGHYLASFQLVDHWGCR